MLKDSRPRRNIFRSADFRSHLAKGKVSMTNAEGKHFFLASLIDLAFEHHSGIGALLIHKKPNSASALLRTFIETCYRAIWLSTCASDKNLTKISSLSRKSFPDLSRVISDIVRESKIGAFSSALPNLELLHDFAHSGEITISKHIVRAQTEDKDRFFEREVFFCVSNSDFILLIATICFHAICGGEREHVESCQDEFVKLLSAYEHPPGLPPAVH